MAAALPVQFAEACPESKLCPTFDEVYAAHFDFVWFSLRRLGVPPAALTPAEAAWAWRIRAVLQGAASFQQEATPTNGWLISFVPRPMA